ncbi:MAG: hypothetical protein M0R46_13590 [Candidatus Muirbacterium halophilum]|nr:hypothetical protein [Candidatus Muirbacterium halophilum]
MKPVLIIENSTNSLIKESLDTRPNDYILSGIFTEFSVVNRNNRIYTAENYLPVLEEFNQKVVGGSAFGELDHPETFTVSLSRASHVVRKTEYVKESNLVRGEIKLLSTTYGKEAKAIIDDGLSLFVSSRAAGVTEGNGHVAIKKLFTYDLVCDPGFASAMMENKPLNESLGYEVENTNFRIYEMSDESKINELFNMNKNDYVTKQQLTEYSEHLVNEMTAAHKAVKNAISKGKYEPKKLEELISYYENLRSENEHMVKYMNYLANKISVVVKENKSLKDKTTKLVEHNDYLAENIQKTVDYVGYIAENLDKNIGYSEYIAEHVDNNIAYSKYLAENLDKNIGYSEYIAENLDKNIAYSEYLAEHVDNNIAYSEYLAEHTENNIAYTEYLAEQTDKSIEYQAMIVERLNNTKINEGFGEDENMFPTPIQFGFHEYDETEDETEDETPEVEINIDIELPRCTCTQEPCECPSNKPEVITDVPKDLETQLLPEETPEETEELIDEPEQIEDKELDMNTESALSQSIDKLIEEAKKRKVSETSDLNFLKFLNKSQIDSYYALSNEDQEAVKLHISESNYFTAKDVLTLIAESLSSKNETLEERVIRLMPDTIKAKWQLTNESTKKSILSQAKLYPSDVLMTEQQIEHFWLTRNLKTESNSKKLISEDKLIQEDRLSDTEMKSIMERFKQI